MKRLLIEVDHIAGTIAAAWRDDSTPRIGDMQPVSMSELFEIIKRAHGGSLPDEVSDGITSN